MAFTALDVKALRETTGCGMLDCKKALTETDGDMEKAIDFLREKGLAAAAKKSARVAAEGAVLADYCHECKVGAAVEVNSETDFAAKSEKFLAFIKLCLKTVMEQNPADVDALLACEVEGRTLQDILQDKVLVIGENLKIRRFTRYEGDCASYVHMGGKIGVLVRFDTDVADKEGFAEYGKDVAMQIAASQPLYICPKSVPESVLDHEKEVFLAQIDEDPKMAGKPDAVKEKMIEGKVGKYYKENCLISQAFIKDPDIDVEAYTEKVAKELGGSIRIAEFVRFEKGEGLEKKAEENLADEVAKQIAQAQKKD
ncbi:MAG TPA: translation elongation factor Ts [Oscillospiraceae bacterium]|nr:elongation factor Ts [Oscillospiraceae bacterium]HNW04846.1 translation elongation factor Ts [Oscillospiraceae bacterium]HPV99700.1 translation elongation factor Ts [Oscillospiraceae bacterium]